MKSLIPAAVLSWCAAACSQAHPVDPSPSTFQLEARATTDESSPLAGVALAMDGLPLGTTDGGGRLASNIHGSEGSSVMVTATCPSDFETPEQPAPLKLSRTRAIDGRLAQPLIIEVHCRRQLSDVVIVVRAERGEHLPVLVDGKALATTDDEGVAHLLLRRQRADRAVQLGLDTSNRPTLKPVNPTRTYELHGRDSLVFFEPSFAASKPQAARSMAPHRRIPIRVD
jgi:hypothetical protein